MNIGESEIFLTNGSRFKELQLVLKRMHDLCFPFTNVKMFRNWNIFLFEEKLERNDRFQLLGFRGKAVPCSIS